jgi:hypothetical protein
MRSNVRISAPLVRSMLYTQHRSFSASVGRQVQYGFIGLGQMGTSRDIFEASLRLLTEDRVQYGPQLTGKATFDRHDSSL